MPSRIRERPLAFACCLILAAASLVVFVLQWSHYNYSGTATVGAGSVVAGCLTYAFSGAIFGGALVGLVKLVSLATGNVAHFKYVLFNIVWFVFVASALYAEIKR